MNGRKCIKERAWEMTCPQIPQCCEIREYGLRSAPVWVYSSSTSSAVIILRKMQIPQPAAEILI